MKMLEMHLMFAVPEGVETNDDALNALGEYIVATKGEPAICGKSPIPREEWGSLSHEERVARAFAARSALWERLLDAGTKGRRLVSHGNVLDAPGLVVAAERKPTTQAEIDELVGGARTAKEPSDA